MRLDEQVTYREPSSTTDDYGETTSTYSDSGTFWAQVEERPPSERRDGGREEEVTSLTLTVRTETLNSFGIGRDSRLQWDGDDLRVNGVRSAGRDGFADLFCSRIR